MAVSEGRAGLEWKISPCQGLVNAQDESIRWNVIQTCNSEIAHWQSVLQPPIHLHIYINYHSNVEEISIQSTTTMEKKGIRCPTTDKNTSISASHHLHLNVLRVGTGAVR